MTLRVQGISPPSRAAPALAVSESDASVRLHGLATAGLAEERTGKSSGFTLTPDGATALDKLLADEGLRGNDALAEAYERFVQVDPLIKRVCTAWQMSDKNAALDQLLELHDRAKVCLRKIAVCAPRFVVYGTRLQSCVDRLLEGDESAFTAALAESYHTVWFELHQDLLLTLDLKREE